MPILAFLIAPFLITPAPVIAVGHLAVAAAYGVGCVEMESDAGVCQVLDIDLADGATSR